MLIILNFQSKWNFMGYNFNEIIEVMFGDFHRIYCENRIQRK